MRFGLSFLPDATRSMKLPIDYYKDAIQLSVIADEAGLHFVKMTEHYLHPYGGYCPSPITFLTAIAARTREIRLLTGGVLPVFHHPIQLAAQASMLDAISGGRVEIGFARAYLPYEFEAFGVDLDSSRERFTETIRAIIKLWQEPDVTIENRFFGFRHATSLPPCTQVPHPPVWVAAVQSRQSFAWIGQEGFRLLISPGLSGYDEIQEFVSIYRESFLDSHPEKTPEVALSLPVHIHKLESEAIESGDFYLGRYLDVWRDAAKAWDSIVSPDYPRYSGLGHGLRTDSPESMRQRVAALVGSPGRVADQIHWLKEKLDIDVLLMQIDFGAMPGGDANRSLELFVKEVWPACV